MLGLLLQETRAAMQQLGAPSLKHLTPAMVKPNHTQLTTLFAVEMA